MFKLKAKKITLFLGATLLSNAVLALDTPDTVDFINIRTPTPESKFQTNYITGTSFKINYGAFNITDITAIIGSSGTTSGSLFVKEDVYAGSSLSLRPRRANSSFQTRNPGPLTINAAWDGFNIANQVTTAYRTDLNRLITEYNKIPAKNASVQKVIHFYLPPTNFGSADFQTYAKNQVGIKGLRPNTFRTKSIAGGVVTYEYCRNSNNEAIYIRNCSTNGNTGTIGTFTVQYLTSVGTGKFCWHNYDRNEIGQMTINGTPITTAVACVN